MKPFVHNSLPGRIVFGVGTLARVPDEVASLGGRALLIASPQAQVFGDDLEGALGSTVVARVSDVRQHVPEDAAAAAREAARSAKADVIVTIGGGSATGLGKIVALEQNQTLLAIPTTYAGSEMTPIYGMTGEHKITGTSLDVLPKTVVYDPTVTVGLPAAVTGPSAFNAIAHCVEALYGPGASPVTSLMAVEGISVTADVLPRVIEVPEDLDARSNMQYGAYLAGASLAVAGIALHHEACHALATYGLNHGEMNSVLLPHVVAYNAVTVPEVMAEVGDALGVDDPAAGLFDLAVETGAPTSLEAIGMPHDGIADAARRTVEATTSNPRSPTVEDVVVLLEDAFQGRRPEISGL